MSFHYHKAIFNAKKEVAATKHTTIRNILLHAGHIIALKSLVYCLENDVKLNTTIFKEIVISMETLEEFVTALKLGARMEIKSEKQPDKAAKPKKVVTKKKDNIGDKRKELYKSNMKKQKKILVF